MKKIHAFLLFLLTVSTYAQTKPFNIGVVDEIQSTVLNEKRILNIYLPDGYEKNTAAYPVIYLLDGSANEDFIHIVGLVQFMTMTERMPASIVVGIANVDRKRDFTYPTTIEQDKKDFPTTGSSEKFISFLEKELQPYITKNYRISDSKTIIGQSLGALVSTEILLKKPNLFTNYIIVSPSLWWDNESLLHKAPQLLSAQADTNRQVYVSVGSEGKIMEADAKQLHKVLVESGKKNLKVFFQPLPEENHATILHNSIYKALETLNPKKS
ncbi:alpha/beta hydrolase [Flavobacterium sp.]|uniref:alpha/beta hydrolase n=1 Tax=Flavobacterium sp. TaxID=239 RepID=UPI0039E5FDFE